MEDSQGSQERPVKRIRHDLETSDEQNLRSRDLHNFIRLQNQTNRNDEKKFEDGSQAINLTVLNESEVKSEVIQGSESETTSGNRTVDAYPGSVITCTDYNPRMPNQDNALLFPPKPYPHLFSPPIVQASYLGEARYSAMQQSASYTAYPQPSQHYGLPPFDALWPGVKTEDGSHSHPGYLSYSTGFSSDQTSPAYYSYPVQGAGYTRTGIYSAGAVVANVAAPSSSNQEYHSYTSLGQSQYVPYFPSSNYGSTLTPNPLPASSTITVTYQPQKAEAEVSTSKDPGFQTGVSVAGQTLSTTVIKELKEQSQKNPSGKSKGKGKKSCSSPPPDNELERIFVWDLDETIIIFHSLLTGSFAQKFGKDPASALTLGLQMEEMIFDLADTHLFFNDLEECDQVHVEDVAADDNGQDLTNYDFATDGFHGSVPGSSHSSGGIGQGGVDWMRKLAFRYRQVKKIYNTYSTNVGELLKPPKRDSLRQLKADVEVLTDSWLATALKSLMLIQSRNCINILVTTTQLVPALAKVLLYGLGGIFPIENIYSATKIGKESCFERIVSRFGKKVTYVVIGDGRDEEYAAKQHNMPFWRILNHGDLMSLHQALEMDYL
ncbi:eyes absent homolog 3-like isoform X2 [Narcine bancroftii]|uniref:eyes absent homolog 3-like isoform X2 n=1 Tax=Narcine bancroftii TaxID=1343680 RepID=UPI00383196DB